VASRRYPVRTCVVCGVRFEPGQPFGRCCGPDCSLVLSALKRLKRRLGPWRLSQRDRWGRLVLRAAREAWKTSGP
jgi:predicted nucleic acid-binding Zn ribbon protein